MAVQTDDPEAEPGRRDLNPLWILALAAAIALVVVLIVVWKPASKAPYSIGAVSPSVSVEIVKPGQAQHELDRLAGAGRLAAPQIAGVTQLVIGKLRFDTPGKAPHDGQYALFVIDKDDHRPVPDMWGVGPAGSEVRQGWDGAYNRLATKYGWLKPLADARTEAGAVTDPGTAVSFRPDTRSPVTFVATLRPGSRPVTDASRQLTIALVFLNAKGDPYWATELPL